MANNSEDGLTKTRSIISHEFETEWKINVSSMEIPGYRTPIFAPVSWIDARFFFDVWYQKKYISGGDYSFLIVMLKKLSSVTISQSFEFDYKVQVCYSNGSLYEKYESGSISGLNDLISQKCIDVVSPHSDKNGWTPHGTKMRQQSLTLKCSMKFKISTCNQITSYLDNMSKFTDSFKNLYSSRSLSDLQIRCGEKTFSAHKCVLVAHSPVFKAMLEKDFLEAKTDTVDISDFEPEIIESFLKFLYSADIEDRSFSSLRQLYILADKYDVQYLKQECVRIINETFLTLESICGVLTMASDFSDCNLRRSAINYAADHIQEIATTAAWRELVTSFPMLSWEILASSSYLPIKFCPSENKANEILPTSSNSTN